MESSTTKPCEAAFDPEKGFIPISGFHRWAIGERKGGTLCQSMGHGSISPGENVIVGEFYGGSKIKAPSESEGPSLSRFWIA